MDKFQFLKNIKNKDDRVIISNVLDKYEKYNNTGIFTYTNFLDLLKIPAPYIYIFTRIL